MVNLEEARVVGSGLEKDLQIIGKQLSGAMSDCNTAGATPQSR